MTLQPSAPHKRRRWLALFATVILAGGLFTAVAHAYSDTSARCDVQVPNKTTSLACTTDALATVQYIGDSDATLGSSGTGIFVPFVRLQGSPTEQGFNTNAAVTFDAKTGTWTHAIKVSGIPVVPCRAASLPATLCWELFNDINESNTDPHISLNKVEVYFTSSPLVTGYPFTTADPAGTTTTKQYNFSGNILINDVNQGSGRGDLRYLIPINGTTPITIPAGCNYGNASCSTYFVLYSQWGTTASYNTDGGFEEWKVKTYPAPPSLKLVKSVTNDNGGTATAADWTLTATGSSAGFNDTGNSTTFHNVTAGVQYTLTESAVTGYTAGTVWSCSGGGAFVSPNKITLANAEQVTCTITNNDNPPALHLRKVVVNDNGGTAVNTDWTLTATGALATPTNLTGTDPVDSGSTFKADTYTLAESGGPTAYTASAWVCVGGTQGTGVDSNKITVALGGGATCTITNNDTKASPAVKTAQGWSLFDTANFTGIRAGAPDAGSATVTFNLWSTNTSGVCSGLLGTRVESITGGSATTATGIVVSPTTSPTTYYWTADYSGDQYNNSQTSACGTETTTISFAQPAP